MTLLSLSTPELLGKNAKELNTAVAIYRTGIMTGGAFQVNSEVLNTSTEPIVGVLNTLRKMASN